MHLCEMRVGLTGRERTDFRTKRKNERPGAYALQASCIRPAPTFRARAEIHARNPELSEPRAVRAATDRERCGQTAPYRSRLRALISARRLSSGPLSGRPRGT